MNSGSTHRCHEAGLPRREVESGKAERNERLSVPKSSEIERPLSFLPKDVNGKIEAACAFYSQL